MAGLGTIVSVTDNLLVALQSDSFKSMCFPLQLEGFRKTVTCFRKWLVDLDAMEENLSPENEVDIQMARHVIYEVDDLVDELLTRGQWLIPHKMQWMDNFKLELDRYVNCPSEATGWRLRRKKTHPHVKHNTVGREEEVQALLQMLLHCTSDVLSIVGMGGIGKTNLAKLLFNHPTIQSEFPLRLWVCVSRSGKPVVVKDLLSGILSSAQVCGLSLTPSSIPLNFGDISIEMMGIRLCEIIGEKKYMLVLDDIWNIHPQGWLLFKDILPEGGEGSRILVTTRLKGIARIVGDFTYELKGLSQQNSWSLFQRIAFLDRNDNDFIPPPDKFVEIAKQIVHRCCRNPMAIREVAGVLLRENFRKWELIHERGLAIFNRTWTLASLKTSYYNLGFTLKSCFSYCALFPMDSEMHKRMLISLWIAQGYIVSSKEGQRIEDVGDECFSALLEMGFFEVLETDEWGEIISCKIHGLMHSVAKEVAGKEFYSTSDGTRSSLGVFHLFQSGEPPAGNTSVNNNKIRSYLRGACSQLSVDALVNKWKSLRTLDLHGLDIKMLPDSIGKLLHLRYLDLSHNIYLETLPNSIVKLQNLQTLDLRFCAMLKELPQECSRLSTLRCLDMFGCDRLTRMPPGMEKLTCLHNLSLFVAAEGTSSAEIRDLKKLVRLRGRICILIPRSYTNVKRIDWKGGCLEAHEHLQEVWVRFLESHFVDNSDQRVVNYHKIVLEKLQPHGNIRNLMLWGYQGAIIAKWGRAVDNWADTLPYLAKIELRSCEKLKQLPLLRSLPHLKSLKLHGLRELEYLENAAISSSTQEARAFFPSLQELELTNAPMLRGFWDSNTGANVATFPSSLLRIELRSCEKLQHLPLLSNLPLLESLKLYGLSNLEGNIFSSTSSIPEPDTTFLPSLEVLEIVDVPKLRGCGSVMASYEAPCFRSLNSLVLANLPELKEFYSLEDGDNDQNTKHDDHTYTLQFACLSELRVSNCLKLVSMPLTPTLEVLEAVNIHADLLKNIVSSQGFQPSSSTSSTLRKVEIVSVHELHDLPACISNVESLTIRQCELLETLALGNSSYVKQLTIQECGRLKHISPMFHHLSCLEDLEIKDCEDLDWNLKDDGGSGIAWQNFKTLRLTNISKCESITEKLGCFTTLEKLSLSWVYDLRALPYEIELLDNLTHLTIRCCPNLTVLPESLGRLPSLKKLEIECCSRLQNLPESLPSESVQVVIRNCPMLQ